MVSKSSIVVLIHVLINIFLIVGGLNWGYVTLKGQDFLAVNFGQKTAMYLEGTVGIAALIKLAYQFFWLVALYRTGKLLA